MNITRGFGRTDSGACAVIGQDQTVAQELSQKLGSLYPAPSPYQLTSLPTEAGSPLYSGQQSSEIQGSDSRA